MEPDIDVRCANTRQKRLDDRWKLEPYHKRVLNEMDKWAERFGAGCLPPVHGGPAFKSRRQVECGIEPCEKLAELIGAQMTADALQLDAYRGQRRPEQCRQALDVDPLIHPHNAGVGPQDVSQHQDIPAGS